MYHYMIRLDAGHDQNGNPKRCYVLYFVGLSGGVTIENVWTEGYSSCSAVPPEYCVMAHTAPTIPTTPSYYREMIKLHKEV